MSAIGRTRWAIPGGHIPLRSTGDEPAFTSHDRLAILNAADEEASLEVDVVHAAREPVGPYRLTVAARRVRTVRVNDLIDPEAVPLGEPYGLVIRADRPVVVQLTRQDTGSPATALMSTIAFGE